MNKYILKLVLFFLFSINIFADDKITITGTILPSAVVGFVDVSGINLSSIDTFRNSEIDFGSSELGGGFNALSKNFYVKSNNPNGVSIKIEPDAGEHSGGGLTGETGEIIGINYYFNGLNTYNMGDTIILTETHTNGSEKGKAFLFAPNNTSGVNYTAGTYSTVLKVTISLP